MMLFVTRSIICRERVMALTSRNTLFYVLLLCLVGAINGDDDLCNPIGGANKNTCFEKLKEGVNCKEDSALEKCFDECAKKKGGSQSYYTTFYKQMQHLEEAICEAKLETEAKIKTDCTKFMFTDCKDAYDNDWTKADECKKGKDVFATCKDSVTLKTPNQNCEQFMTKVHSEFEKKCPPNGASKLQVTFALILAFIALIFTQKSL